MLALCLRLTLMRTACLSPHLVLGDQRSSLCASSPTKTALFSVNVNTRLRLVLLYLVRVNGTCDQFHHVQSLPVSLWWPANQATNQPAYQSTCRPIFQPTYQPCGSALHDCVDSDMMPDGGLSHRDDQGEESQLHACEPNRNSCSTSGGCSCNNGNCNSNTLAQFRANQPDEHMCQDQTGSHFGTD